MDVPTMCRMWIDDRGSEVLAEPECHRLLALGAKEGRHGHIGIPQQGAPMLLPLDYAVHGPDVVVRIGEGLFHQLESKLVAFQVDGVTPVADAEPGEVWSVLVQGLATEDAGLASMGRLPQPQVVNPGGRLVRIRTDVLTGRRFSARQDPTATSRSIDRSAVRQAPE